jgi:hypothetical protein
VSTHPLEHLEAIDESIIAEWATQLHTSNTLYSTRPFEELLVTCRECFDAYIAAIRRENFELLNRFIGRIVSLRGALKFPEHEVVDAFRGFRKIASDHLLTGLIEENIDVEPISDVLDAICQVVDYAILRFSEIYYTARVERPH